MKVHRLRLATGVLAIFALPQSVQVAGAQESAAKQSAPVPPMNAAEKQFQETMSNATMTGFFTVGDSPQTHPDQYTIEKVTKIRDDLWTFEALVGTGSRKLRATVPVPVKWAGETPVIALSNYLIKDHGVFTVRVLIHNGMYAGTWGAQDRGGKMFGKIVKNETPAK